MFNLVNLVVYACLGRVLLSDVVCRAALSKTSGSAKYTRHSAI